jgi:hypothetical protein
MKADYQRPRLLIASVILIVSTTGCGHDKASTKLAPLSRGAFTPVGQMVDPHPDADGPTATLLSDGKVLIAGGSFDSSKPAELYDPATRTFRETKGSMVHYRDSATASILPDGRVLIVGGEDVHNTPVRIAEIYDPTTDSFSRTGALSSPGGTNFSASPLPDGRVLMFGVVEKRVSITRGCVSEGGGWERCPGGTESSYSETVETYDPKTGSFTEQRTLSQLPIERDLIFRGGNVYLLIGDRAAVYDPSSESVHYVSTSPFVDAWCSAELKDGRLLIVGVGDSKTTEVFDPKTDQLIPTGSMSVARRNPSAILLRDGRVLVVGGQSLKEDDYSGITSAEIYNPETGTFSSAGSLVDANGVSAKDFALNITAVLLSDGSVLLMSNDMETQGVAEIYRP